MNRAEIDLAATHMTGPYLQQLLINLDRQCHPWQEIVHRQADPRANELRAELGPHNRRNLEPGYKAQLCAEAYMRTGQPDVADAIRRLWLTGPIV